MHLQAFKICLLIFDFLKTNEALAKNVWPYK